uniref:non-specific serine/threonine protein kinase n=1 Tax=Vernicia montana TaxID=316732 RepID=A0A140G4X3_9ROSI|nr:LRR-RLK [Vernicia montana]
MDFSRNYLNGPIPTKFGGLQNLTFMDLSSNILSGSIPEELGKLTQLYRLILDNNELNGSLPEGLGNLTNLGTLRLSSNNLTGSIPQSYFNLTQLEIFRVGGNYLSGGIPDFIADWGNLEELILVGNNFEGNIAEGIFNLPKLEKLWVVGLRNPGLTFPKKANMSSLQTLTLRNCSINGTIPSYIAQWLSLTNLDLSFNNLIGEIPKFSPYLKKIFLTRNKLNGTLPPWIINEHNAPERTNDVALMDLSNNDFANVPSVNHENGTLSDSPNSIIEPRSEYISQKIKECKVKYRSLSINSGGEAVKFGKQNYENDTALSNFYLSPQGNWAYSFSGDYISPTINASGYIKNLTCGVSLPEAQLYVNARVAPVSLTYYAFCLHQGKYNVELHFAETLYSKKEDHSKVGKRVFDVHIQGKRVLQDFNIKKEAGDANKNVMTRFPATVAKNKPLSIEFFWTGRGSLYNPPGQNGPLISAISITRAPRKLSLWEIVVIVAACVLGLLILLAFMWRMGWIGERELRKARIELETQDGKKSFTVKEIIDATGNFSPRKKIGKDGRFGIIYKAELSNLTVAVKKLFPQSKAVAQIGTEVYARTFKLVHDNLVQLLATYSRKDLHLLIYEYMDRGSLEQALFDPKPSMQLSWKTRYSICLQIAQGLEYLHAKNPPIIHRDIKASNILLDGSSKAKISDFGLAKLYEEDNPFMFIEEGGTRMYMAPEYATHKAVTVGVDVFSFGVLLLEIVTGIKNDENLSKHHDQTIFLLEKVANLHAMVKDAKLQYKKVKYAELVDEKLLNSNYSEEEVVTIIDLAMLCTDQMASLRPIISDVVSVLEGKEIVENVSKIKVKESSTV